MSSGFSNPENIIIKIKVIFLRLRLQISSGKKKLSYKDFFFFYSLGWLIPVWLEQREIRRAFSICSTKNTSTIVGQSQFHSSWHIVWRPKGVINKSKLKMGKTESLQKAESTISKYPAMESEARPVAAGSSFFSSSWTTSRMMSGMSGMLGLIS